MKIYSVLAFIFISFVALAYSGLFEIPGERNGGTELNGSGCVCHTPERDTTVSVWVEGPDTLRRGQKGVYFMYLAGGPAQAGGYNVAGRFGIMSLVDSFSVWDFREPNELTQAFPLVFPTTSDTISWTFEYTVSDSSTTDTIYSCGLSLVYDSIPDFYDRWNFGSKFPIVITDQPVSVRMDEDGIPDDFFLLQNYPNPFNPVTKIQYTISTPPKSSPLSQGRTEEGFITLIVYDLIGNEVAVLVHEPKPTGIYEADFNADKLPSGIYLANLRVGKHSQTIKMVLIK